MKQEPQQFHHDNSTLAYLSALPQAYNATSSPWPLIVFLHGRGECGDDLDRVKLYGLPKLIDEADDFPCVTISPQCPAGSDWTPHIDTLVALIESIVVLLNIDAARIYLTGLSMGGRGSWRLALADPERFAAIVAICGRYDADWADLSQLSSIPIRLYHGAKDRAVPLAESKRIFRKLSDTGADVDLVIYPGIGHNAWDLAYSDPELLDWLFRQARSVTRPPV